MTARKKVVRKADARGCISARKLIRQLEDHALGKIELRPTQVSAALGLLKKALPDMGKVSLKAGGKAPVRLIVGWAKDTRGR